MEPARLRYIRGDLAVFGPPVDAIAESSIAQLPVAAPLVKTRDPFHITVATRDELRDRIEEWDESQLAAMAIDSASIVNLGVGAHDGVYFTVIIWKQGLEMRREMLGLSPRQLHIMLTGKHHHSLYENARSIWQLAIPLQPISADQVSLAVVYCKALAQDSSRCSGATGARAETSREIVTILNHILSVSAAECRDAEMLDLLAVMLYKVKDMDRCLATSTELVSNFPTDPRGYFRSAAYYASVARSPSAHPPAYCWKLAMMLYGEAAKHALLALGKLHDEQKADVAFFRKLVREACQAILQCARFTEFGCVATSAEVETFPEEHLHLMGEPWNPGVRNAVLQCFVERGEPGAPTQILSMESRERLCVYQAESKQFLQLPRFFRWVTPFRLAAMSTPKNAQDIRLLEKLGISTVVTLTKEEELNPEWFSGSCKIAARNVFIPITNYKAPTIPQIDYFFALCARSSEADSATLVHCGGGKGRAGTFVACYLARYGFIGVADQLQPKYTANEIIQVVRQMRPGSIETDEQEQFIASLVKELWKRAQTGGELQLISEPEPEEGSGDPILQIEGRLHPKCKLIVCCGIPGSGKSTVSKSLANAGWIVASQDETGSWKACAAIVSAAMRQGRPVIIDRCNPTVLDRKQWMDLAMASPNETTCLFFDYDQALCLQRANLRMDHPTLPSGSGAANAVRSMSKNLQRPTLSEGFGALITIRNFATANKVVQYYCGTKNSAASTQESKASSSSSALSSKPHPGPVPETRLAGLHKFPRTRHLFNFGSASRDDLIMTKSEAMSFFHSSGDGEGENIVVTLEEKVDGANLGFSIDPETHEIRAQNRSHFVTSKSHPQFRKLDFWIENHREDLMMLLTSPYPEDEDTSGAAKARVLFGEWLYATHSIHYKRLPDYFLAFDLYEVEGQKFWSRARFRAAMARTSIHAVPRIELPESMTEEVFREMMGRSSEFYDGSIEGVYVRRDRGPFLLERAKVVRPGFISGNAHWSKAVVTQLNLVDWRHS